MTWDTLLSMSVTCGERLFWWDAGRPADASLEPLGAVIFDLDGALADVERDGQRRAFNAAFAEHGLDINWSVEEYGRLVCIADEQRRIASALRRRGFGRISAEIAAHVYRTKNDLFEESVLAGDVTPRAGLDDLVNSLYFAGVPIAAVSKGARRWVAPLVRQLIGDGIAETIVTPDDLTVPGSSPTSTATRCGSWGWPRKPRWRWQERRAACGRRGRRSWRRWWSPPATRSAATSPGRPRCAPATTGCWPAGASSCTVGGRPAASHRGAVASAGTLTVIQYFPTPRDLEALRAVEDHIAVEVGFHLKRCDRGGDDAA